MLVVMEHAALSRYQLPTSGTLRIGRADDSDVLLHGAAASRNHAVLHVGHTLEFEDLGSRNGTRVRDKQLTPGERVGIGIGDPIHIGSSILVIHSVPQSGIAPRTASSKPSSGHSGTVIVRDPAMREIYLVLERVAPSTIGILILGETGVGKEVVAAAIHRLSGTRSQGPFICINCAALNPSVFESEMFGHQQGSFTGAVRSKQGLLEMADRGTVFLDEIGELPLSVQAKLLRAIETRQITRVGGLKPVSIDVRFIAATNRDLRAEVQSGLFREDLFFRLNGTSVRIPPLRERPSEIELFVQTFLASTAMDFGCEAATVSEAAMQVLRGYSWPGNIRELKNVIECASLLSGHGVIEPMHLPPEIAARSVGAPGSRPRPHAVLIPTLAAPPGIASSPAVMDAAGTERDRIIAALTACNGNQTRAAEYLNMPRRTLVSKLASYGIPRPRKL